MLRLTQTSDLQATIPTKVQNRLTQEMEQAETKQALLEDVLERAESLAFSYLRGTYSIEALVEQKPQALVDAITTIAKYRLYQRVSLRAETVFDEQREAVKWLRDMGAGEGDLIPGSNNEHEAGIALHGTASRKGTLFNRRTMR